LELNGAVEDWVLRLTGDRRSVFEYALSRAGLYSDVIRTELHERGLPEDLLYLALIESDFHTDARSRVQASGMWQFMAPTARLYGLRIDAYVDERFDPVRATHAALDHLNDLYHQYGSWYLAAAAYNVGSVRVSSALQLYTDGRTGDDDLYWEITDHLPRETANYVPKLLAATYLARSAALYGFDVRPADPYEYDFIWSPGGLALADVAHSLGIEAEQMYDLNPQLIRHITPPGEVYRLRIPVGTGSDVVVALASPNPGTRLADD
jgi:membrane-bound lytic murein transglycosylase D